MVRGDRFIIKGTGLSLDGCEFVFEEVKYDGIYGNWREKDGRKNGGLLCYERDLNRYLTLIDNPSDNIPEEW